MGKKIVGLYALLCLMSFAIISVSCFSTWYQQTFKTLGFKTVLKLQVSLLTAHVPGDSILFCSTIKKIKKNVPARCQDIKDPQPLQDLAADWCSPVMISLWPVPCEAFNTAYILGLVVIITYGLNVVFLCSCFYLLYYYVESKSHKPIYRTWAAILHAAGTGGLALACVMYTVFAMMRLNALGGSGIPGFFEASASVGMTPGFFAVWVGLIVQGVALGLHVCMQVSGEETEEQKLYKEMLREQQQYGAIEAQMAGSGGSYYDQGAYPQAASPQDFYAQQQYAAAPYPQTSFTGTQMPPPPVPEHAGGPHLPGSGQAAW